MPGSGTALDMGSLLAGTKYRGDFEARVKSVLKQLEKIPHAILFIDQKIHTIIGAGSTSGGTMDASNLLKPALAKVRCALHQRDHLRRIPHHFRRKTKPCRRFPKIDVVEPTVSELFNPARLWNRCLKLPTKSAKHSYALKPPPNRTLHQRAFPARCHRRNGRSSRRNGFAQSKQKKSSALSNRNRHRQSFCGFPKTVSHDDKTRCTAAIWATMVYGQENAIDALVAAAKCRVPACLPDKPIGNFFPPGPAGQNREAANSLPTASVPQRFDMSGIWNAMPYRVHRYTTGYVGFEQGGLWPPITNSRIAYCSWRNRKLTPTFSTSSCKSADAGQSDWQQRQDDFQRHPDYDHQRRRGKPQLPQPRLTAKRERRRTGNQALHAWVQQPIATQSASSARPSSATACTAKIADKTPPARTTSIDKKSYKTNSYVSIEHNRSATKKFRSRKWASPNAQTPGGKRLKPAKQRAPDETPDSAKNPTKRFADKLRCGKQKETKNEAAKQGQHSNRLACNQKNAVWNFRRHFLSNKITNRV